MKHKAILSELKSIHKDTVKTFGTKKKLVKLFKKKSFPNKYPNNAIKKMINNG